MSMSETLDPTPVDTHREADRALFPPASRPGTSGDPEADALCRDAARTGACVSDILCDLGVEALERGNTAEAYNRFSLALQHDPRHFESHHNLSRIFIEARELDIAQLHLEICACLVPESCPQVYLDLGVVFTLKDDYDEAQRHLAKFKRLSDGADGRRADALLDCVQTLASVNHTLVIAN